MYSQARTGIAIMVRVGFRQSLDNRHAPSVTNRFSTSCDWQQGLTQFPLDGGFEHRRRLPTAVRPEPLLVVAVILEAVGEEALVVVIRLPAFGEVARRDFPAGF